MDTNKLIKDDLLLYSRNKRASTFALLGLVFNCLYFMILYGIKTVFLGENPTMYVQIEMGVSVILTLVMLLAAFLSSEGVKSYNKKFSIVLLVLAVFEVARIFFFPLWGLNNDALLVDYFFLHPPVEADAVHGYCVIIFVIMVVYLLLAAACYVYAAVDGYLVAVRYEKHKKLVESGEVDIYKIIKEEEQANQEEGK